jgi:WD40 repeat protein
MLHCVFFLAAAVAQAPADWPVKCKLQTPEDFGNVFSMAVSPDGKSVAAGMGTSSVTVNGKTTVHGGDVLLWDSATGKLRKSPGKHGATVNLVSFSRDGKLLGSFSAADGEFKVWDLGTGKLLQTMKLGKGINDKVASMAFDGKTLLSVDQKEIPGAKEGFSYLFPGTLTARDAKSGKVLWSQSDSGAVVMGLSPDGKVLALFNQKQVMEGTEPKITERSIKLLDALTGKELRDLERGELGYAGAIGFSQQGKTVYASHGRELYRWDAQDGKMQPPTQFESWKDASTLALSPDGRTLAMVDFMGERAGVLSATEGKILAETTAKFPASLKNPAFSPDLKFLACTRNLEPVLLSVPSPK